MYDPFANGTLPGYIHICSFVLCFMEVFLGFQAVLDEDCTSFEIFCFKHLAEHQTAIVKKFLNFERTILALIQINCDSIRWIIILNDGNFERSQVIYSTFY